jgi:hypothetical protein
MPLPRRRRYRGEQAEIQREARRSLGLPEEDPTIDSWGGGMEQERMGERLARVEEQGHACA